jgi:hypothetical protein
MRKFFAHALNRKPSASSLLGKLIDGRERAPLRLPFADTQNLLGFRLGRDLAGHFGPMVEFRERRCRSAPRNR